MIQPIGSRITDRRIAVGMSLSELARRAGISKGYLSRLESGGAQRPGFEVIARLAAALGTTPAELATPPDAPIGTDFTLLEFALKHDLPAEDLEMLAHVRYRGRTPRTERDWWFLYEAIKRATI
jgi:transcriptional regulator with XRE-family HTH domain